MATDLETDVLLGRLCLKVIKRRSQAKTNSISAEEGGYRVIGSWQGKSFTLHVDKVRDIDDHVK